jgi:hypothetical protein
MVSWAMERQQCAFRRYGSSGDRDLPDLKKIPLRFFPLSGRKGEAESREEVHGGIDFISLFNHPCFSIRNFRIRHGYFGIIMHGDTLVLRIPRSAGIVPDC